MDTFHHLRFPYQFVFSTISSIRKGTSLAVTWSGPERRVTPYTGVINMDYLFVIFALASMGLVFAGVRKISRHSRKNFTRLEL